jgi:hypothetical protein
LSTKSSSSGTSKYLSFICKFYLGVVSFFTFHFFFQKHYLKIDFLLCFFPHLPRFNIFEPVGIKNSKKLKVFVILLICLSMPTYKLHLLCQPFSLFPITTQILEWVLEMLKLECNRIFSDL